MQTIVNDVHDVCRSVCLSVMRLKSAAACEVYAACRVCRVIWCSLCQMPLISCLFQRLFGDNEYVRYMVVQSVILTSVSIDQDFVTCGFKTCKRICGFYDKQ